MTITFNVRNKTEAHFGSWEDTRKDAQDKSTVMHPIGEIKTALVRTSSRD